MAESFPRKLLRVDRLGKETGIPDKQRKTLRSRYEQIRKEGARLLEHPGALGNIVTKDHATALLRVFVGADHLIYTEFSNDNQQLLDLNQKLRTFDERYGATEQQFSVEDYRMISWVVKIIEDSFYDGQLAGLTTSEYVDELSGPNARDKRDSRQAAIEQTGVLINRLAKIKEQSGNKVQSFDPIRFLALMDQVDAFAEHYTEALTFSDSARADQIHEQFLFSRDTVRKTVSQLGKRPGAADLYGMKHLLIAGHFIDRSGKPQKTRGGMIMPASQLTGIERLDNALRTLQDEAGDAPKLYHLKDGLFDYEGPSKFIGTRGTHMHIRPEVALYFGFVAEYFSNRAATDSVR